MSDLGWIIVITAIAGVGGTGLGGVVGEEYADPYGQGRIVIHD